MKQIPAIIISTLLVCLTACHRSASYDAEKCRELAVKVERNDSLTQKEYSAMIDQNEAILVYLIERNKEIKDLPREERSKAWREMLAQPEYMERFSYMFTLGSGLYNASVSGKLDDGNKDRYDDLDRYNKELADYSDAD